MHAASQTYARNALAGLKGRALEAAVLIHCANRLSLALAEAGTDMAALNEALAKNQSAWSIFAREIRNDRTDLPSAERASFERAIAFVFLRTMDCLADLEKGTPDPARFTALIEINREIAAGLRGQASDKAA